MMGALVSIDKKPGCCILVSHHQIINEKTFTMKRQINIWILIAGLTLAATNSFAQQSHKRLPKYISERGYWVIEGNVHNPRMHTIWFYNNDNELVYKEAVNGVRLNPARRKVRMKLKQALETSITAWERNKFFQEDKGYVATILR
jgi:hypothetical protein